MQLNVRVVEARGLAKMDTFGKSDPYAILRLVGSQATFKTAVIKNTLTPVWNEQFHFSLYNPSRQALFILLKDEDLTIDEEMATLEVQLASLIIGDVIDQWYEFRPVKGVKIGGQIHLVLHIGLPRGPEFVQWRLPPLGQPPFVLNLRIIAADQMEKMDILGKTDPYFILTSGGQTFTTSIKSNTLTPRYDEDFQFNIPNPANNIVKLLLRDKDLTFDDDISSCELQTAILPFGQVLDVWIELTPAQKVKKGGRAHVLLHVASASQTPFMLGGGPEIVPAPQPVVEAPPVWGPPPQTVVPQAVCVPTPQPVVKPPPQPVVEPPRATVVKPPGKGGEVKSWGSPWGYAASSQFYRDQRFVQNLFDNDEDKFWASSGEKVKGEWIEAKYEPAVKFTWLAMKARRDRDVHQSPRKFVIQGSKGKDSFVKLAVVETPPWHLGEERIFNFSNAEAFPVYRVVFKKSDDGFVAVGKVRFGSE
jgi:hypothetical protein